MRSALVTVALILSFVPASWAANYKLEFHSDQALSSCELAITSPGFVKVYMVLTGSPGFFGGVEFKAPMPVCMTNSVWLGDIWDTRINGAGNTQATGGAYGVTAFVGTCEPLPRYLGYIWYNVTGPVSSCCPYAPQPGKFDGPATYINAVIWTTCTISGFGGGSEGPIQGSGIVVNADQSCRCDLPLATQESTWGSVKALYR